MSDVPLPSSSRSGRQAERPRSDERPGPVHARLDLVDEEQVAATSPAFVEVADHGVRDAPHAADGLDQLHLDDGELVAPPRARRSAPWHPGRRDRRNGRRGRAGRSASCTTGSPCPSAQRRVFPPKPALSARTCRLGYWATRASLSAFSTAVAAADRGQDAAEAGEAPEAGRQSSASRSGPRRHPERHSLIQIGRRVMPADAASDPAHDVEDRLPVDDDERARGADVGRLEPGGPDEPKQRGVVVAPEGVAATGQVVEQAPKVPGDGGRRNRDRPGPDSS